MLIFGPPELRDELASAIEAWKREIDISEKYEFSQDIIDVTDPDFDPADYQDRVITRDTEFNLGLPKWEYVARVTYGEFVELARELSEATLESNCECRTDRRYLLRIRPANNRTTTYLWHTLPEAGSRAELRLQEEYLERSRETDALSAKLDETFEAGIYRSDERFDEGQFEDWQRARLTELDDTRKTAERELKALRDRREYLDQLEQDRDALLDSLMGVAPSALDSLTPEERHLVYNMLRLKVVANLDGSLEVSGAFGDCFVLWKDQSPFVAHDEVDLSEACPVVAFDGRVPFLCEVP